MYKYNRIFFCTWALVFLSLIVPNSLHPNWYGGWSFSGRFGWAGAVVFLIPTMYGLLQISKDSKRAFATIVSLGLLLQLYFFYQYAVTGESLYNKGPDVWFNNYSIFYFPISSWLPALYDSSWAFGHAPNYAWLIVSLGALLAGFLSKKHILSRAPVLVPLLFAIIFMGGLLKHNDPNEITYKADQLPAQTGRISGSSRVAEQPSDNSGLINFGPYIPLRKGSYEVILTYISIAAGTDTIGWFDISNTTAEVQLFNTQIYGTDNAKHKLRIKFVVDQWPINLYEFRTYWNGVSNIEVQSITLKEADR